MTAQEHIISTLGALRKPAPKEDLGGKSLEEAIYEKVMSHKFRKLSVDKEGKAITKKAIKLAVENKKSVTVSILFGGNKLWRFEEAPEIDWAELFATTYFVQWLKPILNVYKYGVRLDYYSQDVSVESLNNIPREETDKYSATFKDMIKFLEPYLPKGFQITYRRHIEGYKDPAEYYKELEEGKRKILAENNGELPKMDEKMKAATELNVKLRPWQDKDPLWREKVELEHQAIFKTKVLVRYFADPYLIPACPTWYPATIATGSTKRSLAKFWAGVGVLRPEDDSYAELVLTPKQLDSAKFDWEDVNIKGLMGKNFKKIRIMKN